MANLYMDRNDKMMLDDELKRLDDDKREVQAIRDEMDKMLYDVERRISRLRSRRA